MMEIFNTQNKVYNDIRRTYIDENDCKEGQKICNKCGGGGSWPKKMATMEDPSFLRCNKCQGKGIVDWIENVVGRPPPMSGVQSSSSCSSSGIKSRGMHGSSALPPKPTPPPSRIINEGFSIPKWVTKIKRRKIV